MLTETNPTLTGAADCPDPHQSQQRESMSGSGYPKFKNDRGVPEIHAVPLRSSIDSVRCRPAGQYLC